MLSYFLTRLFYPLQSLPTMKRFWDCLVVLLLAVGVQAFTCRTGLQASRYHSSLSAEEETDNSAYDIEETDEAPARRRRGRVRPLRREGQLSDRAQQVQDQQEITKKLQEIAKQDPNLLVEGRFHDWVTPPIDRALKERLAVEQMTVVQQRTWAAAREGESLVVKARTGTGKTLAFLVPLVERLLAMDATVFQPGKQVGILIVAPTRELVVQIAETAKELLAFSTISVRTVYGGTSRQRDVQTLQRNLPGILVATPGRLVDLIGDARVRGRKVGDVLKDTTMVVLDEADMLVEGGFAKDVQTIIAHLPRKRQTMLFSATLPRRLEKVLPDMCMSTNWTKVDCVEGGNGAQSRIDESYLALPSMEMYVPLLLALVRELVSAEGGEKKVIVFLPAVRMVRFFTDVLREVMSDISVSEMHSQISQSARRRVTESFRESSTGVLITSDVSARGMDYPDVGAVLQYGLPSRRDFYWHRIGRTGRAGRMGRAIVVLLPWEKLDGLGRSSRMVEDKLLAPLLGKESLELRELQIIQQKVRDRKQPLLSGAERCFLAFMAYYANNRPKSVGSSLIRSAGESLARSIGLDELPEMSESLESEF